MILINLLRGKRPAVCDCCCPPARLPRDRDVQLPLSELHDPGGWLCGEVLEVKFREIDWHDASDWEDNPTARYRAYTFPGAISGVQTVVRTLEVWQRLGEGRSGWMCEQAVTSALRHVRCTRRRFPYIHPDSRVELCPAEDFTEVWTLADEAPDAHHAELWR